MIGGLYFTIWRRVATFLETTAQLHTLSRVCRDLRELDRDPEILFAMGYHVSAFRFRRSRKDLAVFRDGRLESVSLFKNYDCWDIQQNQSELFFIGRSHPNTYSSNDGPNLMGHVRRLQVFVGNISNIDPTSVSFEQRYDGTAVVFDSTEKNVNQQDDGSTCFCPSCFLDLEVDSRTRHCRDLSTYRRAAKCAPFSPAVERLTFASSLSSSNRSNQDETNIVAIPAMREMQHYDFLVRIQYRVNTGWQHVLFADWSRPWPSFVITVDNYSRARMTLRRNNNSTTTAPTKENCFVAETTLVGKDAEEYEAENVVGRYTIA